MNVDEPRSTESISSIKRLVQLFIRPKQFFSDFKHLNRESSYIFAYIVAMSVFMDRVDSQLIKNDVLNGGSLEKYDWLIHTWIKYWGFTAIIAIFFAFFIWFVYGWWYEMRLKWSGVENQSSTLIRQVNIMQLSIMAIPVVIITLVQTAVYPNYEQAFLSPEMYSALILIFFNIYSCWVSYVAVKNVFNANKYALLWFLFLPLIMYASAILIIVTRLI
ncbi:YIP1 family protein [Acinetobacter portensis]|uniref:YIP1 family protein n=1 Tax=Acinetobacter portensis TaxID=1839785 RepID=UPI0013D5DE64|nr:YIP1 family protein [Acinetobacter portensis]